LHVALEGKHMSDAVKPLEVFYSYAHEDERLRDKLEDHLSILKNNGLITGWHARDIRAGAKWEQEISEHLNSADIILLLVSATFLASSYCYGIEMARALERHAAGEARVIPVILRAVDWEGAPFGHLRPLPTRAKPITSWDNRDEAFQDVAKGIRKVAKELRLKPIIATTPPSSTAPGPDTLPRQPGVWTVPYLRNPHFTGREELLAALRAKFASGPQAAWVQAIHGVGKTQLAVEYAYRYAGDYDAVLWVRAEEPTALAASYAGLAKELGIPGLDARDQDAAGKAVLRWLREHNGWLLVFDNAPNGKQIVSYLPPSRTGHVLITSRYPNWREYAHPVDLDVMTPDEAIDLLLKRTGEDDRAMAGKLAEELGHLPLALVQASAYIEHKQRSLADYLPLFKRYRDRALIPSDDYPVTIAATWGLSFQAVREQSSAAADLLNLCAFFAPEDIPLDMIVAGAKYLPKSLKNAVLEPLELDTIVEVLGNYSLVEVDKHKRTMSVHRLVQAVVRDKLSPEERQGSIAAALQVVKSAFTYEKNDTRTWVTSGPVLPQALAVIALTDLQDPGSTEVGKLRSSLLTLLNQVGLYLRHGAQYGAAKDYLARALALGEALYGKDHTEVAKVLNNLGWTLYELGELQEAQAYLEKALAINEAEYGANHPTVANDLNYLGWTLYELGHLQDARACLERALAINEAEYGPDHPEVARGLHNVGWVLKELGYLQDARSNSERALAIDEAVYGPDHPSVAVRSHNLGLVLHALGDLERARFYLERALAIDEAKYDPYHPEVANDLNNLGMILKDLGHLQDARSKLERALAIDEAVYEPNNIILAGVLDSFGQVLTALNDLPGARAYLERALAIDEAGYGPDHPEVAGVLNNLGQVLKDLGDLQGARAYLERALAIFESRYGPDHPKPAEVLNNLGSLFLLQADLVRAQACLDRAYAIFLKYMGPSHPKTVHAREALESVAGLLKQHDHKKPFRPASQLVPGPQQAGIIGFAPRAETAAGQEAIEGGGEALADAQEEERAPGRGD
jgi:tetratricopeptide (TPR) repeat protein